MALGGDALGAAEQRGPLTQRLTRMETNGHIPQSERLRFASARCENVTGGSPSAVHDMASLMSVPSALEKNKQTDVFAKVPDY